MRWQAKALIWTAIIGTGALLISPPEVQIAVISLTCGIPAMLGLVSIGKSINQYNQERATYYAAYPDQNPKIIKEKRKAEKESKKKKAATGDAALGVTTKRTKDGLIPVVTRRTRNDGTLILNQQTRTFQTPKEFHKWLQENEKKK